ncbi:MAG: phage protease [Meiothermus sp.]|nr:phage protease [Meiothermus sp.]
MLRFLGLTSRIALLAGSALPDRVPLHPFGEFTGNRVRFVFDEESLAAVRRQLADKGVPWVLDLNHSTVALEEGEAAEAPAYGFVYGVEVVDGFVYGLVEWTDLGREKMAGGAYNFVSPVLLYDEATGRVLGYHSHAVTNRPGTFHQRRIGLTAQEESMNLRQMLGLPETATDAEVQAALATLQARAQLGELVMGALELQSAELTAETRRRVISLAANEGLAEELRTLREQLTQDRQQRQADAVAQLVGAAVEDGRILEPDRARYERLARLDLEGTRAVIEGLPKRVPTEPIKPGGARAAQLTDDEAAAYRLLGLSAEQIAQHGGN